MSTEDFLSRTTFNNLEASIELALSQTEGFRDEAENFADLARRGIRLVGVVANLSSFPANPEDGDAVFVESETQIYFWDAGSSTWKNSQIVGSAIWGNVQGTLADQTDLQTALDGKVENWGDIGGTLSTQTDLQTALDGKADYDEGTWTINDESGAGLTLTVSQISYEIIGSQIRASAAITYPTTADTSNAQVTAPAVPVFVSIGDAALANTAQIVQSQARPSGVIVFFQDDLNGFYTNADLSGKTIRFNISYRI